MKTLRKERSDSSACHDDRSLRAEGPPAADRDRRRKRLEQCDLERKPALTEQDGLDRFRNSVSPNLVRPEPRHEANNDAAQNRDRHDQNANRCLRNHRIAGR